MGVGEGPFFVSEKFALEECLGDRSAVDCDEGFVTPFALIVDLTRDDLFAGPVFTEQEDSKVRIADASDGGFEIEHLLRGADELHLMHRVLR